MITDGSCTIKASLALWMNSIELTSPEMFLQWITK